MRPADELSQFVRDALIAGRSRPEIDDGLNTAGWSAKERESALQAYAETAFTPPIPRPRPYVSAKDAFVYGLMFIALGASAISLNVLFFAFINLAFPSDKSWEVRAAYDMIRISIAILVFAVPIFGWLSFRTTKAIGNDAGKRRSAIRKVITYLTLFIAAIVVVVDLVSLVYALLSGDATMRFLLKTLSVGLIFGTVFIFYFKDASADE